MTPDFRHKILILKADDLGRGDLVDPWRRFIDICIDEHMIPSIGIVASDFRRRPRLHGMMRHYHEEYGVEIWNHSSRHRDLTQLTAAERIEDTLEAQAIIADCMGAAPTIYGPPFNRADADAIRDIDSAVPFEAYYFAEKCGLEPHRLISKAHLLTPEVSTQALNCVSFDYFEAVFRRRQNPDLAVMQVHPGYWHDNDFEEFRRALRFLFGRGYQPLTACEFLRYREGARHPDGQGADAGSIIRMEERLYARGLGDCPPELFPAQSEKDYYFGRLKLGTTRITRFLGTLGLSSIPNQGEGEAVLDVGGGVGNWAMASKAGVPKARVVTCDTNARLMAFMREIMAAEEYGETIEFLDAPSSELPFRDASFRFATCNNALNYMQLDSSLREFARTLKPGGGCFLGVQSELYPLRDAFLFLQRKDFEGALNRMERIIRNEARRHALPSTRRFITYWSDEELVTVARYSGLQPVLRGLELPEAFGVLFGRPTLWGYLFICTHQSSDRARTLASGTGVSKRDVEVLLAAEAYPVLKPVVEARRDLLPIALASPGFVRHAAAAGWIDQWPEARDVVVPPASGDPWAGFTADERTGIPAAIANWMAGIDTQGGTINSFVEAAIGVAEALKWRPEQVTNRVGALIDFLAIGSNLEELLAGRRTLPFELLSNGDDGSYHPVARDKHYWMNELSAGQA